MDEVKDFFVDMLLLSFAKQEVCVKTFNKL